MLKALFDPRSILLLTCFVILASGVALAQVPSAAPPAPVAAPTAPVAPIVHDTTRLALDAVVKEFQAANQASMLARQHLSAIEQDIIREYPGHHLDELALPTVSIVPDTTPAKHVELAPAAKAPAAPTPPKK